MGESLTAAAKASSARFHALIVRMGGVDLAAEAPLGATGSVVNGLTLNVADNE